MALSRKFVGWSRHPTERGDLSPLQQEVLVEAFDATTLRELLSWCTPSDDGPYWNRKWKYVPEVAAAAQSLCDAGLIEVTLGGRSLPRAEGVAILEDYRNWWEFDPADLSDPVENEKLEAARARPRSERPEYGLAGTQAGQIPWTVPD